MVTSIFTHSPISSPVNLIPATATESVRTNWSSVILGSIPSISTKDLFLIPITIITVGIACLLLFKRFSVSLASESVVSRSPQQATVVVPTPISNSTERNSSTPIETSNAIDASPSFVVDPQTTLEDSIPATESANRESAAASTLETDPQTTLEVSTDTTESVNREPAAVLTLEARMRSAASVLEPTSERLLPASAPIVTRSLKHPYRTIALAFVLGSLSTLAILSSLVFLSKDSDQVRYT